MLRPDQLKEILNEKETIEVPKQIIAIFEEYDDIDRLHDDFADGLFDERISRWLSRYFRSVVEIAFEKKNYVPMKQRYYVRSFGGGERYMIFNKYDKQVSFGDHAPSLYNNEHVNVTQFTEEDIELLDKARIIMKEYDCDHKEPVDELEVDYDTIFYVPVYDPAWEKSDLFAMKYKDDSMSREARFYV